MADSKNPTSKVPPTGSTSPGFTSESGSQPLSPNSPRQALPPTRRAPDLNAEEKPRRAKRKRGLGFWLLLGGFALIGLSLTSLLQIRQETAAPSSVPTISTGDNLLNNRSLEEVEREADRLIAEGRPKDALALLQGVPGTEQKREQTVGVLIERADRAYPERLELAIYILENVPRNAPQYNTAQRYLSTWRAQYDQIKAARFALRTGNVAEAQRQLQGLKGTEVEGTSEYRSIEQSIQSNPAPSKNQ